MKQDFIYHGPATSLVFADAERAILWEGSAHPGHELKGVPSDHAHVQALIANGILTRVELAQAVREQAIDAPKGAKGSPVKRGKEE